VVLAVAPLALAAALGPAFLLRSTSAAPAEPSIMTIFLRDCSVCHGPAGEGTDRGPAIAGVGAAAADYWISTGRMPLPSPTADPTYRRPLRYTPSEVAGLVAYVAALKPGGLPIPEVDLNGADEARGGELFRLQCAACHAWSGTGGALLHREAPPLQGATPTQIAEAVRIGPGQMPAFGTAAIPDSDLAGLVAYVLTLDHPADRGGTPLNHVGPLAEGAVAMAALGALLVAARWIGAR
jgi:ubiquinol-cytochrome c reductase cytochrome c subunit